MNEMTTTTKTHVHDLAVTISAGDVPAELMDLLLQRLMSAAAQAVTSLDGTVERMEIDPLQYAITYDGRRDCPWVFEHR